MSVYAMYCLCARKVVFVLFVEWLHVYCCQAIMNVEL